MIKFLGIDVIALIVCSVLVALIEHFCSPNWLPILATWVMYLILADRKK